MGNTITCCDPLFAGDEKENISWVDNSTRHAKKPGWCVDDSAHDRVFIPDAGRRGYLVVGIGGATIRMGVGLDSPVVKNLPQGSMVRVDEVRARRAHIFDPVDGWASLVTESGYVILEAAGRPSHYKVIYREGLLVRSTPKIEEGPIVQIVPFGTVLPATGKTVIFDGVERVQVEGGWVSMRLREDNGQGQPLIIPLN